MNSKIRDLIEVALPGERLRGRAQSPEDVLRGFLLTYELGDTVSRIVERVAGNADIPTNCLVVGGPGVGKSMLLAAATAVLELSDGADVHQRFAELRSTVRMRQIVVRIPPPDQERRFAMAVQRAVVDRLASEGLAGGADVVDAGLDPSLALVEQLAEALPPGNRIVVAVDDLERWLRVTDPLAVENLSAVARLGELSKTHPISACIAAEEDALNPASSLAPGSDWLSTLLRNFRIEYVAPHAVRTAAASRVLRKNARQRRDIQQVLAELREKLPHLSASEEEFIDLYPLEISTWTIGGHLHRWIEEFSFPEFAARAAESVKGRPALSLFALNDMFSLYEPQLRRVEGLGPIFAAYDKLVAEALPSVGQAQRLWARLALQSIFMHTIAGIAVDVKTLTNSVLIFDLHGGGSSYQMMAAVLKQLEALGREQLLASGSSLERRYSLVSGKREALLSSVDELAREIDDNDDEVAWTLLRFGRQFFADWPFGASGPVRSDLWDIERGSRAVSVRARSFGDQNDSAPLEHGQRATRRRLVIFRPGRPWSEARDESVREPGTACWTGGVPTPAEWLLLKQWVAVTRLAKSRRSKRFVDLDALRHELREQCAAAFRRIYIDAGVLVTSDRSQAMHEIVGAQREENLVVTLMAAAPAAAVASAAEPASSVVAAPVSAAPAAEPLPLPETPPAIAEPSEEEAPVVAETPPVDVGFAVTVEPEVARENAWLAHLLADHPDGVGALTSEFDHDDVTLLRRLEGWYGARVNSAVPAALRLLGERGDGDPELSLALDAKQQFDAALYYVRRALSTSRFEGLGDSVARIFESTDRLWQAKRSMEQLEEFGAWVPVLEEASRYLREAEPATDGELEELRKTLLSKLERPDAFSDTLRRVTFGDAFETYRAHYAQQYIGEHNRSVGFDVIHRLNKTLVESEMWQTLEALSSLSIGNPSYLVDAINLLSVLVDSKCDADVEEELRSRPICSCGFRFADRGRVQAMASSASQFVQTGIEYHRRLIHARQNDIVSKLKANKQEFDVDTIKAIADLTKEGPLPRVDDKVIDALNELLRS